MKKSLLALAVLGAFAGAASAQSSVTLFGVVDLSLKSVKNEGVDRRVTMDNNALNSNRFGVRGVEDLGGGLRAGFHLEGGMANDTGNPAGQTWQRRSTVSLIGGFGEIRLGRDYTPSFWNTTIFDPQGTNGAGSSLNVARALSPTYVRSNNGVGYFLPAMGGVYGQVMFAPGEGAAGRYTGGRIGFKAGPVDVAVATGSTDLVPGGAQKAKVFNVAGSVKFGTATLMGQYNDDKTDTAGGEDKETRLLLGASITMGQGEIRGSWVKSDRKNNLTNTATNDSADDATQISVGYIYNLSPRTALYTQYANISNKGAANFTIAGGATPARAGGKSTALEAGLRHSF